MEKEEYKEISAEEADITYGDVNNDGKINIFDLILLKSYLIENNTKRFSVKAADVDDDGVVSAMDAVELSKYLINYIGSFYAEMEIDTDGDGLSDYIEKEITKTDDNKKDTDGDGLDDYTEVYLCNTDPLENNTDGSDTSDCDRDADGDKLTNGEEIKIGTSQSLTDTDGDGISDYDEVKGNVKSDPLKTDSDKDGISDFGELQLSLDPMNKMTDGKTNDSNRYFTQNLPEISLISVNTEDNFYNLSVSANMRGYAPEALTVCKSTYSDMFEEYAVTGKIIDVDYLDEYEEENESFNLCLKFELKNCNNPEDYMIFKYIEDAYVLLPADTQWEGNSLILNDAEDGTYCIVDLNEIDFDDDTDISDGADISEAAPEPNSSADQISDTQSLLDSVKSTDAKSVSYTCIFNLGSEFKVGFWDGGVRSAVENSLKKLFSNGYSPTVTLIFKGKYYSYGYRVIATCNSSDQVCKICNEASKYFSKSIDEHNAESEYNAANSRLGNILSLSVGSANLVDYSTYKNSTSPVFVFNDIVSEAVCMFRSGGAACSVLKKNLATRKSTYYSIGADGCQKIYDIVTEGEGKTTYKASLFGNILMLTKLTAKMVNDINSKKLTPAERKAIGFMDTDGDGIDDSLEIAMNLLKISDGKIVYPSFDDAAAGKSAIIKGMEIFAKKKNVSVDKVKETKYLPQKLLINNPDSDGDGYSDAADPDSRKKPEYLGDYYDFLDGEIYYLKLDSAGKNIEKSESGIIVNEKNDVDNQKFKFEWCGKGYKISSLSDPLSVLTISDISTDSGKVSFSNYDGREEQLWEVLPFYTDDLGYSTDPMYGIALRSKVMVDDGVYGKSLYLNCTNNKITVSSDKNFNSRMFFYGISDWVRFGDAYMQQEGWINNQDPSKTNYALETYKNNINNISGGFDSKNNRNIKDFSVDVLLGQNNASFQSLKYADSLMSDVACEVIATYNALKMKKYINNDSDFRHFFKLAVEFELGAIKKSIPVHNDKLNEKVGLPVDERGVFGSEPRKIGKCLESYNAHYEKYDRNSCIQEKNGPTPEEIAASQMNSNISAGDVIIASYNFSSCQLAIHTFSGYKDSHGSLYLINKDTGADKETSTNSINEATNYMNNSKHIFRVGYILK